MWSALISGSAIIRSKSPEAILALFEPHLTERQKLELTTMDEIWYFTLDDGEEEMSRGGIKNHGYDDQEHNYIPVMHEHFNYRFELGRKIGQGGQGVVVRCLDHKTQTPVALKILASPTNLTAEAHQMMELRMSMELQTVRSDVDYNVVNVMDMFYFRGHKCIVMELLKKSLHQVLIDMGQCRIDEDDLRSYARGIVRFLAYTKSRGIVHGDIKPGNVLLKNNSSSVVRVTDFGYSFFVDQQPSRIRGTLPYMAPEVVLGYPATCAMDMWSLGCTVAKLAIRKELFVSDMDNDHVACCIEEEEEEKEGEETEKDEDKDKEEKDKDGNYKDNDGNEEADKHKEEDTAEVEKTKEKMKEEEEKTEEEEEKMEEKVEEVQQPQEEKRMVLWGGQATAQ
ncbi:dual specificity tyrosine-phosphorylation-regulated kinase 2-like [Petromyzon marinus]|uniref:dual specificity tyrosine-phosphorylation-regulated kinase 2-like n=1 Tax=Petromyzon marinus TaxID=7757 RepID=UPI003F706200